MRRDVRAHTVKYSTQDHSVTPRDAPQAPFRAVLVPGTAFPSATSLWTKEESFLQLAARVLSFHIQLESVQNASYTIFRASSSLSSFALGWTRRTNNYSFPDAI